MAGSKAKRGGGERVLESRHLVGLFLGVVLLCCVFFTLGYVMGENQYGNAPVHAAPLARKLPAPSANAAPAPPASREWDFYSKKSPSELLKPASPAPKSRSAGVPVSSPASRRAREISARRTAAAAAAKYRPPRIPRGAVVLQVAALRSEGDALALADALQQKGFPAFVVTPSSDNFYRVQVGPYAKLQSGILARQSLEREGFKAILKR